MRKTKTIRTVSILLSALLLISASGCTDTADDSKVDLNAVTPSYEEGDAMIYEAEDAILYGSNKIIERADCSGGKVVGNFESDADYIEFNVTIEEDGVYDISLIASGLGSDKYNYICIDGMSVGEVFNTNALLSEGTLRGNVMTAGEHKISVKKSWGWIELDQLKITKAEPVRDEIYNVNSTLINENANEETKNLFKFLCDSYGEYVIAGQVCDGGINGNEFQAIKEVTGKYPAMLGLDMMRYSPARVEKGDTTNAVEMAIEFSNEGGIVTFCWHWNAPNEYLNGPLEEETLHPSWWGGFYTSNANYPFELGLNGEDETIKAYLDRDIAAIAEQLNILEDAGVPVLWRPLHEASGGWFWWGARGAEACKQLWIYLYEQLTDVYECNNLIWVWNGQNADWYPGDEYVDIIGEDIYPGERVYTPQTSKFIQAVEYSDTNKIVALTENGCVFDIDMVMTANTKWAWFNTWSGEFAVNGNTYSEKYTEKEIIKKAYDSEYVLTLDELPDLKNYQ